MRALCVMAVLAGAGAAGADSTSGIDAALSRAAYDANGVFGVEGARLLPRRDLSFRIRLGYARSPLAVAVPGIGGAGDTTPDAILDYLVTLDMTLGMSITERLAFGLDVSMYRTAPGAGYGSRGRYASGMVTRPSTGLISLRPLSNLDPSASPDDPAAYLGDGRAGPLDTRVGLKYALVTGRHLAIAAIGTVVLPFGDEDMLLGDRNLVYEPRLAIEWRPDRVAQTRIVANLGARLRQRSVLEAYDTADPMATEADARVFLDVGSELLAAVGGIFEVAPRAALAAEVQALLPLPDGASYGTCRRYSGASCRSITQADYWPGAGRGDLTTIVTAGALLRVSADVTAEVMIGAGLGGARADDLRIATGIVWAPQPVGMAAPGRNDRDGDGIPDGIDACPEDPEDKDGYQDDDGCPDLDNDGDGIPDADDACPDEPEDKDGYQDEDGCPERDNDGDGIPDVADRCPNEPEDRDGFEDDDGCPDPDNDGDGFADDVDRCPNDPETVNGFEDDDGCPDARIATGPEERPDRIDLKGAPVTFARDGKLTPAARQLLGQAAAIIKARKLTIRIEVHVPLGTRATGAAAIRAQRQRDKQLAQRRATAIRDLLIAEGVPAAQLQAVGLGSDRPLGTSSATDPINERVDLIKAQQTRMP
jgi:large repetitive protein